MPRLKQVPITDYMVVDKTYLRDYNLGLMERGLLSTMISLPENYDFSGRALAELIPNGRDSVFASLKKLENAGYLKRRKLYRNGRVYDVEYQIAQQPIFLEEKFEEEFEEEAEGDFDRKILEKMRKNAKKEKVASFCEKSGEFANFENINKPNKIKGLEKKSGDFLEEKLNPEKLNPDFQDLVNSPQIKERIKDSIISYNNNITISIPECSYKKNIKRNTVASSQKINRYENDRFKSGADRFVATSLDEFVADRSDMATSCNVKSSSLLNPQGRMNKDGDVSAPWSTYSEPRAIDLQRMHDRGLLVTYVKERIMCYEFCRKRLNVDVRDLDMVMDVLIELLTGKRILIRGKRMGIREIRKRLCQLDGEKVAFVIENYNKRKDKLVHRDMYLKAALLYAQDPIILEAKKHSALR